MTEKKHKFTRHTGKYITGKKMVFYCKVSVFYQNFFYSEKLLLSHISMSCSIILDLSIKQSLSQWLVYF